MAWHGIYCYFTILLLFSQYLLKNIKKISTNYSDFKVSERFILKDFEGEKLAIFNEAGFLEIAIYRSNPNTVGSARSLLGLKYRDVVNVVFN